MLRTFRRAFIGPALLGCVMLTGSTVAAVPAQPIEPEPAADAGSVPPLALQPGTYVATIYTQFCGPIRANIDLWKSGDSLKAGTRKGVAWKMVGGLEGALGSMFAPFLFPDGRILTWETSVPDKALPTVDLLTLKDGEGKIGIGTLKNLRVPTVTRARDRYTEIRYRDGSLIALLSLDRQPAEDAAPATDYAEIVKSAKAAFEQHCFDRNLVASSAARGFFREWESATKKSRDDLEFLFGMGAASRAKMKEGAPVVFPAGPGSAEESLFVGESESSLVRAKIRDDGVAVIRVNAFYRGEGMREAIEKVKAANAKGVVVDLRSCVGVDISGLGLLSWLIGEEIDAGAWADNANAALLDEPGFVSMPSWTIAGLEDGAAAQRTLDKDGMLHAIVKPTADRFAGPVAVIISKNTKSSGEVFAALLAKSGVKVYGEATAGRPQQSREFDAGQGWVVRIASDDYRNADGSGFVKLQPAVRKIGLEGIDQAAKDLLAVPR